MKKGLLVALAFSIVTLLLANLFIVPHVEARERNRWPSTYIECLWKALDYLDLMSANMQRQADDTHAIREKLAK